MQIYDTHAHIDQLKNFSEAMKNAADAGVEGIVAVSTDLNSCQRNLEIKKTVQSPKIFLGMGMHPSEANVNDVEKIAQLARDHKDKLHAVGEIGLDFWYKWVRKDQEKKDEQRRVYRAFLELAKELDLPAVIHSRGVWRETFETAQDAGLKRCEFHWYSGPLDVLDDILAAGYYVSGSPSMAYSPQSREAMAHAPIKQTLIETDSPVYYKNRETEEGFQAEPKDVFRTLTAYAGLKNMKEEEALEILNQNARTFFNLD